MTDELRARFEAWATRKGLDLTPWNEEKAGGISPNRYMKIDTDLVWLGYRAAHADLAGEVLELVEALSDTLRMLEAAHRALGMAHTDNKRVQRARAALAKFHPHHHAGGSDGHA